MSPRTLPLNAPLYDYLLSASLREPPALARLRAETARLPEGAMQTAPEQAQLIGLLIELTGARRVLEIGCFTGYGTLAIGVAGATNAALLAAAILANKYDHVRTALDQFRSEQTAGVLAQPLPSRIPQT